MDSSPLVALEIGTSKVRAVVAQARDDNHLMITGLGECPSRGVRKSEIVDFENALSCVRTALQSAEENSSTLIRQVYLLVTGSHIQSLVNRGTIPVVHTGGTITEDDREHVVETARAVNLPPEREVLHTIRQHFYVDDQRGVTNPVGLEGARLSVDMMILHGVRSRLKNTVRVVRSAQVDIDDVAFSGLCAALAVLGPEEKEHGVLLIDLGGGTTDYLVYAGGTIAAAGSLAVGGDHLTNDISRAFRLPLPQAERLKEQYGSAVIDLAARTQKIELGAEGGAARRLMRVGDLHTITHLRIEEILNLVRDQVEKLELLHQLGAGVVLTGGGAYLKNVVACAERVFGGPGRLGTPLDVSGLAVASEGPEYAAVIGMLRYAARTASREANRGAGLGAFMRRILGLQ